MALYKNRVKKSVGKKGGLMAFADGGAVPMTDEQYRSINAFLATNPTEEALAAAQAQFGVSNDDLAAARAFGSAAPAPLSPAPLASTPEPAPAPTDNWMSGQWYNPNVMPENFDWQRYVAANKDLGLAGIDTQTEAERHYDRYGRVENRSIGALSPKQSGDLSQEDYRAALKAYRDTTGDDRPLTGVNGEIGSDYAPVNQWIDQNYIPQGKFVTDIQPT